MYRQMGLTFHKQIKAKYLTGIIDVEMMRKTVSKIVAALFIKLVCNDFLTGLRKWFRSGGESLLPSGKDQLKKRYNLVPGPSGLSVWQLRGCGIAVRRV